jgi:hypothetical protein
MIRSGYNAAGEALVSPSAGAGTDVPVGILWLANTSQAESPLKEELSVPASAPYELTLREVPSAVPGEVHAYNATSLASITVVSGTTPGGGQIAIGGTSGKLVTADSALAGVDIVVVYRFAISAATLERRAGVRSINNSGVEDQYGRVTIVYGNCTIFTSLFDTEDDWETLAQTDVLTGAGGLISLDGSGVQVGYKTQAPVMLQTPGLEQAFVGYDANLPGV